MANVNFPSMFQGLTNGGSTNNNNNNRNNDVTGRQIPVVLRGSDQYLPLANIVRIMRKVLPTNTKISDDAKETIKECVSEFINFITSEANERCQREQRNTVTAEDLIWGMKQLGFDDYIEPLISYVKRYRLIETGHAPVRAENVFGHVPRNDGIYDPPLGVPLNELSFDYMVRNQMYDEMDMEPSVNGPLNEHGSSEASYSEDSSGSTAESSVKEYK